MLIYDEYSQQPQEQRLLSTTARIDDASIQCLSTKNTATRKSSATKSKQCRRWSSAYLGAVSSSVRASLLSIITGVNDASVLTYLKDTAADRAALLGPNSARDGSVFTWLRLQQPPERRYPRSPTSVSDI